MTKKEKRTFDLFGLASFEEDGGPDGRIVKKDSSDGRCELIFELASSEEGKSLYKLVSVKSKTYRQTCRADANLQD